MKKNIFILCLSVVMLSTLSGCFAGKSAATPGRGGEVTGVGGGKSFREPTPFGMTLVKRGWLKMGARNTRRLIRILLDGRNRSNKF